MAEADRRPLKSRETRWAHALTKGLIRMRVSPNRISASSIIFALVGAFCLAQVETWHWWAWLGAAACAQLRLLANLLDGMVAVGSGQSSPVGELFNEVPDRISDVLFLAALGFVPGSHPYLGGLAAILAVFVAYIRAMGVVSGAGQCFSGWMSKPKRMFVFTVVCLWMACWPDRFSYRGLGVAGWALVLIIAGCIQTSWIRLAWISKRLRSGS